APELSRDTEGDAAAGAAAVEPQHETGLLWCTTVIERIDAERAMLADQPGRHLRDERKTRLPHQRAIAEHPQVALEVALGVVHLVVGKFGLGEGYGRHLPHR